MQEKTNEKSEKFCSVRRRRREKRKTFSHKEHRMWLAKKCGVIYTICVVGSRMSALTGAAEGKGFT